MHSRPDKVNHSGIVAAFIAAAMIAVNSGLGSSCAATTEQPALIRGEQDGYANDGAYNITDPVLLCGKDGFVAIVELGLKPGAQATRAVLTLHVTKVKQPGRVALMHLLNFNNGFAETQDYYATAECVGEAFVEKPGPVQFNVTKAVKKDAHGPGGFTSYRLESRGAEIALASFEAGKGCATIVIE